LLYLPTVSNTTNNGLLWETEVTEIAQRLIRQVMADRGWRPNQLAAAIGKSPELVRRWLRGDRKIFIEDLINVARLGGISLDQAFGIESDGGGGGVELEQLRVVVNDSLARLIAPVVETLSKAVQNMSEAEPALALQDGDALKRLRQAAPAAADARHVLSARASRALDAVTQIERQTSTRRRKRA
jgi:transcriptional regulator with XRE-family HTH domain